MIIENYWEALIFAIVLFTTPGPVVIVLFSSGMQYGFYKTLPFLSGIYLGYLINLLLCTIFIGGAFYLSDVTILILKIVAALYILYLAYKISFGSVISNDQLAKPLGFYHGILLNLINPKAYIANSSIFSIFTIKDDILLSIIILSVMNITIVVIANCVWITLGDRLSSFFKQPSYNRPINIFLALVMLAMVSFAFIT